MENANQEERAKAYLNQIKILSNKISWKKSRSALYDEMSYSVSSPSYDQVRVDHTPSQEAPFVKWLTKKLDLDAEIESDEKQLDDLKTEVIGQIEKLENEEVKTVLACRYVLLMSWPEIVKKLMFCDRTVRRRHEEGIQLLEVPATFIYPSK